LERRSEPFLQIASSLLDCDDSRANSQLISVVTLSGGNVAVSHIGVLSA
jgi:hypothetical protein